MTDLVFVSGELPGDALEVLRESFEVVTGAGVASPEFVALAPRVRAIVGMLTDRIDAALLASAPALVVVANVAVGVDNIDLAACAARNVVVTNTPDVLTECTADLAMTLMLMTMRRAGEGEREVRGGRWSGWRPNHMMGTMVSGKTLGLVGLGRIARAVARRAYYGFGMNVVGYAPTAHSAEELSLCGVAPRATLDEVLAESDVVSIHCPSTPATRGLINAERLAALRPGAFLVNTARGDIIDDDALIAALRSGQLAGAGLDVFRGEPNVDPRYLALDNVVLLPHLGSATRETRDAMGFRALENLALFFNGEPVRDRVA